MSSPNSVVRSQRAPSDFVGQAAFAEERDGALDTAGVVERLLRAHHVEAHAEIGEVAVLLLALHPHAQDAGALDAFAVRKPGELGPLGGQHLSRVLPEIFAVVSALRYLAGEPRLLLDAGPEAGGEPVDLDAGIVDVELAGDGVAGPLVQRCDRVAQRRASAVTDVERPGRVGGDELEVDLEPGAGRAAPVIPALLQDRGARVGELVLGEPEIDEAGAGDLGA